MRPVVLDGLPTGGARKVYVADSFGGLPPPSQEPGHQDAGYDYSNYEELAVAAETVGSNFARYDLLDEKLECAAGERTKRSCELSLPRQLTS